MGWNTTKVPLESAKADLEATGRGGVKGDRE